jgi:hypothetical protein
VLLTALVNPGCIRLIIGERLTDTPGGAAIRP